MNLDSFQCIEMAVFDSSGLSGTYAIMNGPSQYEIYTGTGFEEDIKILKFYNDSDVGVTLSYDSVKRCDFIPSKGTLIIDLQTNHSDNSAYGAGTLNGRKGQTIFGKGSAGTGNIYISGYR